MIPLLAAGRHRCRPGIVSSFHGALTAPGFPPSHHRSARRLAPRTLPPPFTAETRYQWRLPASAPFTWMRAAVQVAANAQLPATIGSSLIAPIRPISAKKALLQNYTTICVAGSLQSLGPEAPTALAVI